MCRVFVTGIGIISSIGNECKTTLSSLMNSKSGIEKIDFLETVHKNEFKAGELKFSTGDLVQRTGSRLKNLTRTSALGMIAAGEAIASAQIENINEARTGLISSTTVAGICRTELLYKEFIESKNDGSFIDTHDCGDSTECIADHLGIKHFISTISTACSSSANAIIAGSRLIKNKILDRAVVGGTDALSKYTLNGFNSLQILDHDRCKPFDADRKGLNLGEGAAYLILESEEQATGKGKRILAEVIGYGNANDAYHQTASSPDGTGAYLAMKQTLEMAGINKREIDYINVHGTGTPNNDLSEGNALKKIFTEGIPKFSSTKSFTGHTLAAAGSIEAVFSVLALQHHLIFPNLNFSKPIAGLDIRPETKLVEKANMRFVLSNSFGFGGNCSSLLFARG